MPIDTKHREYSAHQKQWKRCRHCISGSDAVKNAGTDYLPRLSDQSLDEYDSYLMRAFFYGASGRTVQALLGAVFRKDYQLDFPEQQKSDLEMVTSDGKSLWTFARQEVKEVLTTGRIGLLVDVPADGVTDRAFIAMYKAETILNWQTEVINGEQKLTRVFLAEEYTEPKINDPYEMEVKIQIRVLILEKRPAAPGQDAASMPHAYRQEVWKKAKGDKGEEIWKIAETIVPVRRGIMLDFIPFQFINSHDITPEVDKPPLLDLIDVNLSHYRTSADLEHGAHFTALPTPWVAGFSADTTLKIGSGIAWVSEDPQAKAGYLEFSGTGLKTLRDILADKEAAMAVLGARMLEEQKKAAEAAATHKLRASGENGALVAVTTNISDGTQNALTWMAWWKGTDTPNVDFTLNTDFIGAEMSPQQLTALMGAWQQGGISQDTFLDNLKRGEILPQDRTIQEEKDMIDAESNQPSKLNTNQGTIPVQRNFTLVKDAQGNTTGIQEGGPQPPPNNQQGGNQ